VALGGELLSHPRSPASVLPGGVPGSAAAAVFGCLGTA